MPRVNVSLKVIPASGDEGITQSTHELALEATGTTLSEVLKSIKFDPKKMSVSVNGALVTNLDTFIVSGARVSVEPMKIVAAERPSGS